MTFSKGLTQQQYVDQINSTFDNEALFNAIQVKQFHQ